MLTAMRWLLVGERLNAGVSKTVVLFHSTGGLHWIRLMARSRSCRACVEVKA